MSVMHVTQAPVRGALLKGKRAALVCGEETLTWSQFLDRITRVAGVLRDVGVGPDVAVSMLADTCFEYFDYHFATPWVGGVLVPMNTRLSDAEMVHILNDAEVKVLICGPEYAHRLPALKAGAKHLQAVIGIGLPEEPLDYETLWRARTPIDDVRRGGEDRLALIYTGGTTGLPKGVETTHANTVANLLAAIPNIEFHEDMVYLHSMPVFHTAGSARIFGTCTALGTGVLLPRFDLGAMLQAIEQHRVTHILAVPTMLNRLLNHPDFLRTDLSSVTNLSYGASIMPEALLRRALELMPRVRFTQSYGMTELSPSAAYLQPKYHVLEGPNAGRLKSIGQAIHTAEIRIADEDDNDNEEQVINDGGNGLVDTDDIDGAADMTDDDEEVAAHEDLVMSGQQSVGLSLRVPASVGLLQVTLEGGTYARFDVAGQGRKPWWLRSDVALTAEFPTSEDSSRSFTDGNLAVDIGVRVNTDTDGTRVCTVWVRNTGEARSFPEANEKALFQTRLAVLVQDLLPYEPFLDRQLDSLDLLYGNVHLFSVGHGCDSVVESGENGHTVRSVSLPVVNVKGVTPDVSAGGHLSLIHI